LSELIFRPLDEITLRLYLAWFQDAELKRRIQPPTQQWFNYVSHTPGIYAWIIYENDLPVGQLQLDTYTDHTGSVGLVVNPAVWNQGYGQRILEAFFQRVEVACLAQVEAAIEADNLASLRCFQKAGFIQDRPEPDEEGFLHFSYRPGALQNGN
jgi:RimJ/RimL family protein N-acetyltransferase